MFEDKNEKFLKYVAKLRKNIPERYNQILLFNELTNNDVDWLISISNRTDGKSFNYIHSFIELSLKYNLTAGLFGRTYNLRMVYVSFIMKVIHKSDTLKYDKFSFRRNEYYIEIFYDEHLVFYISDIDHATDLKYSSNILEDCDLIIFDEFLVLESDYLPDEYEKLQLIYSSIDRQGKRPFIGHPKILLLGNAVNFDSPILAKRNMFNILENHPINTLKIYNNVALEMHRNDRANEERNTRAFDDENDAMTTGEFRQNNYLLEKKENLYLYDKEFTIKISDIHFLTVKYHNYDIVLNANAISEDYQFCMELKDVKKNVTFLSEKYNSNTFHKKYEKELIKYENNFTLNLISNSYQIQNINLYKCIAEFNNLTKKLDKMDIMEQDFHKNEKERQLKNIYRKMNENL